MQWPLEHSQLEPPGSIGIALHVFYPELLDEFRDHLARMPWPFDLLVSVTRPDEIALVRERLQTLPMLAELYIEQVPNRGRDLAPMMVTFNARLRQYDFIGHLHTKKTPQAQWGDTWREHLLSHLLGTPEQIQQTFFHLAHGHVGMVYPALTSQTPFWAMSWLSNGEYARPLCERLGMTLAEDACFSFPVGSMFWARQEAVRPLLDLNLTIEAFPEEAGQQDGTLQHAIERLLGLVCHKVGLPVAIIDLARHCLDDDDTLNAFFELVPPIDRKIERVYPSFDALTLSTRDTLVQMPFTHRAAMLRCLLECRGHEAGIDAAQIEGFMGQRDAAEQQVAHEGQPGADAMVTAMVQQGVPETTARAWMALETGFETGLWQPRPAVLAALNRFGSSIEHIGAVIDTPIDPTAALERLKTLGYDMLSFTIAGSDGGTDRCTSGFWQQTLEQVNAQGGHKLLHVGGHPWHDMQSAWQMDERVTPLYAMPGTAMAAMSWPCRELMQHLSSACWQDDLWRGLMTRRLTRQVDHEPGCLLLTHHFSCEEDAGYLFAGPLLLEMLQRWIRAHERVGMRHCFIPVDRVHPAARMYDLLAGTGRYQKSSLPTLHCRRFERYARLSMKLTHPTWQRKWFWSDWATQPGIATGAVQFLEDLIGMLGQHWHRFHVNNDALQALAARLQEGDTPLPSGIFIDQGSAP